MKDFKSLSPVDYWQIFWRRKWYFLLAWVLVSAGAAGYAYFIPAKYRSQTRILVSGSSIADDVVRSADRSSPQDLINSMRLLLQSRTFLERIIEEMRLFGYGQQSGFNMEEAVETLSKNIDVPSGVGPVVQISFASTDPQFARDVTRRLASAVIQANLATRKNLILGTDRFIDEQFRQVERELRDQEEKIKNFKMMHLGRLPDQAINNINNLSNLRTQLASIDESIQQAEDMRKLLEFRKLENPGLDVLTRSLNTPLSAPETPAAGSAPQPDTTDPVLRQKRAQLAELTARYTPRHPDVMRLAREVEDLERLQTLRAPRPADQASATQSLTPLGQENKPAEQKGAQAAQDASSTFYDFQAAEISLEEESIKNDIAKQQRQRAAAAAQIKTMEDRLSLAPALEQELLALTRDYDFLRQRYSGLQNQKFNAQMAAARESDSNNEAFRIVDEANLPTRPAFPDRLQIVLMGIGAGFVAGLGAAFGREYLDPTLGSEAEAARVLKLPVLISIPEIPARGVPNRRLLKEKAS